MSNLETHPLARLDRPSPTFSDGSFRAGTDFFKEHFESSELKFNDTLRECRCWAAQTCLENLSISSFFCEFSGN
jgi:hypothetical protein